MEALEKMAKNAFDVVITDLKMEKVDGLALLEKIKSQLSPYNSNNDNRPCLH